MSFHHMMLTPDQVRLVQRVFKNLLAEPWFQRSAENEQACAKLVIHIYQLGISSDLAFSNQCREQARRRFAAIPTDVSATEVHCERQRISRPAIGEATKVCLSY